MRKLSFAFALAVSVSAGGCVQSHRAPVRSLPSGQAQITVPAKSAAHWLLAPVEINGQDAGYFVVDTGTNINVVDRGVADRLKLPTTWRIAPKPPKAVDRKMREVRILSVGGVTFESHHVATLEIRSTAAGVLGAPVLKELPFTIDYRAGTITFHDRERFRPPPDATSFPVRFHDDIPYVKCRINDEHEGWILLDSGAMAAVGLNHAFWSRCPELKQGTVESVDWSWTSEGKKQRVRVRLPSVELLGHRFAGVPASLVKDPKDDHGDGGCVGLVGGHLLVNFRVTLDYEAKRLWAEWNPEEPVSELVAMGVDLDAEDYLGFSQFELAISSGQTERAKALIAAGAGKRHGVRDGMLVIALSEGDHEVAAALIDAGAGTKAKGTDDMTALMWAAARGYADIVKALLARHADVNASDKKGQTALMLGAAKGNIGTVEALIAAGADVNASEHRGATPLMAAAFGGHVDVVRVLLDKGARANAEDTDGITALISAAGAGHAEVVEILLDAGADVNARDSKGRTALDHARKRKHHDIVRLLRKHQAKQWPGWLKSTGQRISTGRTGLSPQSLDRVLHVMCPVQNSLSAKTRVTRRPTAPVHVQSLPPSCQRRTGHARLAYLSRRRSCLRCVSMRACAENA